MIRVSQVKCASESPEDIKKALVKKLGIQKGDLLAWTVRKKSVDARHRQALFSYAIDVDLKKGAKYKKSKDIAPAPDETYRFTPKGKTELKNRPVVAGYGPAGMFAALLLAQYGYRPIILEKGQPIEQRQKDVDEYWTTGELNPTSNVQFGEGGAGAFSDGKLTTRTKDRRARKVLTELVNLGGHSDILIEAHPHIGTDGFVPILKNLRAEIERLGGTFEFGTSLEDIETEDGKLVSITTNHGTMDCEALILALGHSATVFRQLHKSGLAMENKPFQVGVRVEHPQTFINEAMLHEDKDNPALIPARYALTAMADNHKGIYTFCMCPGGLVIPSASKEGHLVVNGMSYADRGEKNANSALLVQVNESDYGTDLFAGLDYQHNLEKLAFAQSKDWKAPAQNVKDYLEGKVSEAWTTSPSYCLGTVPVDLNTLFSDPVNHALHQGIEDFERKVPGFENGVLTGVETRASSSIRVLRDKETMDANIAGVYPAGEGSGYAGGIMTSAIDGIKCAEALMDHFARKE